jgi:CRP-like cAMP-binding protein
MSWDFFLMLLLFYIALILPFTLGFDPDYKPTLQQVDDVIDAFFIIDLILNFRTGYYRHEILIMDGRLIGIHYLQTWFTLDFLTCFPFEFVTAGVFPDLQAAKLLKIGKVLKVCKLLRLSKLRIVFEDSDIVDALEDKLLSSRYQEFGKLSLIIIMLGITCHWLACAMSLVGSDWEYTSAMYFAMSTLTTVGYGDVVPKDNAERWFAIACMVVGGAFYGYLIGMIGSTIMSSDRNAAAYKERMDQVRSWLFYHTELPKTLRRRIKRHFQKHLSEKAATDDTHIINDLSPALVHDVSYFLIHEQVRTNLLFHNLPNNALSQLMPILERTECEAHDEIVSKGDPGNAMYIIINGVASIEHGRHFAAKDDDGPPEFPNGTQAESADKKQEPVINNKLTIGDSFGEEIILGLEENCSQTIVAETPMKMYVIDKEAFLKKFQHMPEIRHKLRSNFLQNTRPDVSRKQEKRGRATLKEDGIPKAFPDAVLDSLNEISQNCSKMQVRLDAMWALDEMPEKVIRGRVEL